jgi:ribosomal protein S18 acetylase RimI-like enzyme
LQRIGKYRPPLNARSLGHGLERLPVAVEELPNADDIAVVAGGMRRYALSQIDNDESPPIACFVRDKGAVVGGVVGRIIRKRLFVELLWVDEGYRNRGYGSALLAALEGAAQARGCSDALLETLSNPAVYLYQRAGYRLLAQVPDYIPGFSKHVLLKPLA